MDSSGTLHGKEIKKLRLPVYWHYLVDVAWFHHHAVTGMEREILAVYTEDRLPICAVEDLETILMRVGKSGIARPKHNMAQVPYARDRLFREDALFYIRRVGDRGFRCFFQSEIFHASKFITGKSNKTNGKAEN